VNVAAGTPAGNYTVTYQICDKLNPTICDTASVTVPVVTIDAVNNAGSTVMALRRAIACERSNERQLEWNESCAAGGRKPDTGLDHQCRRDLEHCGWFGECCGGHTCRQLHRNLPDLRTN